MSFKPRSLPSALFLIIALAFTPPATASSIPSATTSSTSSAAAASMPLATGASVSPATGATAPQATVPTVTTKFTAAAARTFTATAASTDDEAPTTATTAATPHVANAANHATSFTGRWNTTFGTLTLDQLGRFVTGRYALDATTDDGRAVQLPARLMGSVDGTKLTFVYEDAMQGHGWFKLAADGRSFTGQWRIAESDPWQEWSGTRWTPSFAGLWQTTYGPMRLSVEGSKVRGTYAYAGGSHLTGTLKDNTLTFSYEQPDGEKGTATFSLAADGSSFSGTWQGLKDVNTSNGQWHGTRITPRQGVVWLVVLEANWEEAISQPEYAFGDMLRGFFSRVPHVNVRHRYVHDLADLKRWCGELAYIAEPVVLHISSHATAAGLTIGSETIGEKEIIACLADVDSLKLMHFGSCLIMAGDIPAKIIAAREPSRRFPISGYTQSAGWAESAIVDFTYLSLIFERGMTPEAAAAQTLKSIDFAKDNGFKIIDK